jgi:nucleotide-binding universal stress UspA family protein
MQLFQTMLVAADFSERSREAFRVASALADERTTRMIVLHIIEKAPVAERAIGFDERGVVVALGEDSSPRTAALHERLRDPRGGRRRGDPAPGPGGEC